MDKLLDRIKDMLEKTRDLLQSVWRFLKQKALVAARYIQKIYRSVPATNRTKASVLVIFGLLVLMIVALLCVPKSAETVPEGASWGSRLKNGSGGAAASGLGSGEDGAGGEAGSGAGSGAGGTLPGGGSGNFTPRIPTSDAIPPDISVPSIGQQTGGKAGHTPSASERAKWEQILIYLEQCENFEFADADKEQKLGVAAARRAIELFDYKYVNDDRTEYWIDEIAFKNYYHWLSGQYLRGGEMNRLQWEQGSYLYTQPDGPLPLNVAAEITSVHLLEGGFYRVEGIVTRGKEDEEGRYSRKLTVLLTTDPLNSTQYYVMSMNNREAPYTPLADLKEPVSEPVSGTDGQPNEGSSAPPGVSEGSSSSETSTATSSLPSDSTAVSDPDASEAVKMENSSEMSSDMSVG